MMNWSYIGGFFDGEGTISVPMGYEKLKRPVVIIYQSEKAPLLAIQQFMVDFGIECYLHETHYKNNWTKKAIFRLQPKTLNDVRKFLYHVFPHLILKRQLAEDSWRWARAYPALTRRQNGRMQTAAKMEYLRKRWAR